jgi:hypothetical protein
MDNKHTPTPPKDEAIFPIKVNAKPNSKYAIKLAQSIMVKLDEKKEMENNESKWTTIKGDSMYLLIDPSGAFVASASKLNCDSIASTLNNYQALKEENEEYRKMLKHLLVHISTVDYPKTKTDINNLLTKHSK